jgi:hypothetical protein
MSNNAAQAVLEEVLRFAMEEALLIHAKQTLSEEDDGALMAYVNLLEMGKQQAAIQGVRFADFELNEFNPYSLIDDETA